jgi:4a-hydroxytetrahydrobiopterin dehydratase
MRHRDDVVAEAEGEQELGRVRDEADDPHTEEIEDMARLEDDQIDERLQGREWRREGNEIVRDLKFEDFAAAMAFVNRVADAAEAANHHPDILVHGWNRVRLAVTNHAQGGLTEADFALADRIDGLV